MGFSRSIKALSRSIVAEPRDIIPDPNRRLSDLLAVTSAEEDLSSVTQEGSRTGSITHQALRHLTMRWIVALARFFTGIRRFVNFPRTRKEGKVQGDPTIEAREGLDPRVPKVQIPRRAQHDAAAVKGALHCSGDRNKKDDAEVM
ncbi:unnamed protein product [Pieris macdunnoughi]|uniref:Uncharacterized protein n=1 Tax=Pieris macdunnoughi TaxID=345717 RepID=A0A821NLU7_9NEOP|nr:unnamed protein product [Pieris macdunnoughi]